MELKLGEYEHFKGKHYKVLGVAKHSETLEVLVIYQALYGGNQIWARPINMFFDEIEKDGEKIPRFKFIK